MGVAWKDIPEQYKPHWSTWKIEGTEYEKAQQKLSKLGLRDPWMRNEVWKEHFSKKINMTPFTLAKTGWKGGVVAFLVVIAAEKIYSMSKKDEHH